MSQLIGIQRRFMRLGKIRFGDKGPKGEPRKLAHFRLTSASKALLEAAAAEYGGAVRPWENAPDEGTFELYTETDTLDIVLPPVFSDRDGSPTLPYQQAYELWSGGGIQRRCDGETEVLTGKACMCNPDERTCKITTRLNVILPKIPGLGTWTCESHGYNAAAILPGTLDLLMMAVAQQQFIPALLRLEQRTSKQGGQTRRFVVPVIDLPTLKLGEVLAGGGIMALNAPAAPPSRPELPAGEAPPEEVASLHEDEPPLPEPPEIEEVEGEVVDEDETWVEKPPESPAVADGESRAKRSDDSQAPSVAPGVPGDDQPGGFSTEVSSARQKLTDLVTKLGATESLEGINAKAAEGDLVWLKRQLARARKTLAERDRSAQESAEQEPLPDGYFTHRGEEMQEAQAARRRRR